MATAVARLSWLGLLAALPAVALKARPLPGYVIHNPCRCLNWKEVYASKRSSCGEFSEFGSLQNGRRNLSLQEIKWFWATKFSLMKEICGDFIQRLNERVCLNANDHDLSEGAWCYVSSQCYDLDGGQVISNKSEDNGTMVKRDIKVKFCTPKKDRLARDLTPPDMFEFSRREWHDFSILSLHSYPKLWPQEALWSAIEPMWFEDKFESMPHTLQEAIVRNKTVLIYTGGDMHSHYKLVWGTQLIHLDFDPKLCQATRYCYTKDKHAFKLPRTGDDIDWPRIVKLLNISGGKA